MIIYPAIDIRNQRCVRLTMGDFQQETVYGERPADMARRWEAEGGQFLHVVDLDGARQGEPVNLESIRDILAEVKMPVQLGGGIRSLATVEKMLMLGVNRVILGSVAVKEPELVREACRKFPDRVVVGIDGRQGIVAVHGWEESGNIEAMELAKRMADCGVTRIVYTDISRDGMLQGVNVEESCRIARESGLKVIASGGVGCMNDIRQIRKTEILEGVIVGKALYTGAVSLAEAIRIAG